MMSQIYLLYKMQWVIGAFEVNEALGVNEVIQSIHQHPIKKKTAVSSGHDKYFRLSDAPFEGDSGKIVDKVIG